MLLIKNIIFDLGNVLLKFQPVEYLSSKLSDNNKINEIYEIIFKSSEWLDLDRGVIDEAQAINNFCMRSPDNECHIRSSMEDWYDLFSPIEKSVEVLKHVKSKGYNTYILSNFHEKAFEYVTSKFDFFRHFDGGIISYREKLLKPEIDIYMKFVTNYGLKPGESLFVDDTEVNVEAARQLGFNAIHFKSAEQFIEELKSYNVL